MPSGACAIRAMTKTRGAVWRVKYRDATGRQVMETLGPEREGWTRKKAQAELRARLVAVEREGLRRPEPLTFGKFAHGWLEEQAAAKGLKRSTRQSYATIVSRHLTPTLGRMRLDRIGVDEVERLVAGMRRKAYQPRTVNRTLNVLNGLMKAAVRKGHARVNPVGLVDRPRDPRRRWRILTRDEIRGVEAAFGELAAEAETEAERVWRDQARTVFVVSVGTGMRRGELLGLRWRHVHLADPDGARLDVRETWTRNRTDSPKSECGERTIALGPRIATAFFDQRARSVFQGDDERVFGNPQTGAALDPKRYAATLRLALAKAGITDYVRPFHDLRHSSITRAAIAGTPPAALMARAGHSDFSTTQIYIDLAGEVWRQEAERLENALWGDSGRKSRYMEPASSPGLEPANEAFAAGS
jgi:integrase